MKMDKRTRRLIADPDQRRAWVVYQLSISGRTITSVAEQAGVKRQTLYGVFRTPYPRMEKIISNAVGLEPTELFPERYDADGQPNRKKGRPPRKKATYKKAKNNTRASDCNGKTPNKTTKKCD